MDNVLRSRYVMVGGIQTHYTESGGDGPALVMVHGGGVGTSGGLSYGGIMALLADRFRCIAIDSIGGWGWTDPFISADLGAESRATHLSLFVDALCLDKFSLLGASQGAWVASRYATQNPGRINRLVLVASGTIGMSMGIVMPKSEGLRALEAYDGTRDAMRVAMEAVVFNKALVTDDGVDLRQSIATRPGALQSFRKFQDGHRNFVSGPETSKQFDMREKLPILDVPATFIWGTEDEFALPEVGRELEPLLQNFRFHWVGNAGHHVYIDRPDQVANIIRDSVPG